MPKTVDGYLYQARVWREYAMWWNDPEIRRYAEQVIRVSRGECMRRARLNVEMARQVNQAQRSK